MRLAMTESKELSDNREILAGEWPQAPEEAISELTKGGTFAGRYKILSLVGSGGMGSVYKAFDLTLNRNVALKLLHRELIPDDQALLRFQQEARATTRIKHPGVIAVYDFGAAPEDQRPYLIMDYVEGSSLSSLLAISGKLDMERALAIFSKVADTLAHTHSKGVIHRDLKPSNILVMGSGQGQESVRVVDFGIAKILEGQDAKDVQKLTQTGQFFGSPLYMSPEQCAGVPTDHRSDIYSLGCVMYEALTGKPPFEGATVYDTIRAHLNTPPAKLDLPSPDGTSQGKLAKDKLEGIVIKTLAKEPERRYQSMAELRDDLDAALALLAASADKDGARWTRWGAALAGVVLLCGIVLSIVWFKTSYFKPWLPLPIHVFQNSDAVSVIQVPANYLDFETIARGSLGAARHSEGDNSRTVWQLNSRLAGFHMHYGFYGQAVKEYEDSIKIMHNRPEDYTLPEISVTQRMIADCYFYERKYDKALYWYEQATTSSLHLMDASAAYFVQIYANMGDIYYAQGDMTGALTYFQKAMDVSQRCRMADMSVISTKSLSGQGAPIDHLVLMMSLADSLYCCHRYKEAVKYYDKALSYWCQRLAKSGDATIVTGNQGQILPGQGKAIGEYNLALSYAQLGEKSKARWYFQASWLDLNKYMPADDPALSQALSSYSDFLIKRDFILGYFESAALRPQMKKRNH